MNNIQPKTQTGYNYLFEEPFDSESGMKLNEIKGSKKQNDDSSEELDESSLEDLYEQLMGKSNTLGLNTQSEPFRENVIRPSLQYKEAYISGDIYPHKSRGQAQNGTCL